MVNPVLKKLRFDLYLIIETSEYFLRLVWLSIAYIQVYGNEPAIMLFFLAPENESTHPDIDAFSCHKYTEPS